MSKVPSDSKYTHLSPYHMTEVNTVIRLEFLFITRIQLKFCQTNQIIELNGPGATFRLNAYLWAFRSWFPISSLRQKVDISKFLIQWGTETLAYSNIIPLALFSTLILVCSFSVWHLLNRWSFWSNEYVIWAFGFLLVLCMIGTLAQNG